MMFRLSQKERVGDLVTVLVVAGLAAAANAQTRHDAAMRDGIKLATDVYLPAGDGKWPAILMRTPYGRGGGKGFAAPVTAKGYAVVAQDIRGRGDSEGHYAIIFSHGGWTQHQDGYDTVEWIAKQSWCDGNVATWGGSALGITQNMMAPSRPPHLRAQHVLVAFSNMYSQCAYQGGVWRKALLEGWLTSTKMLDVNLETFVAHPNYDAFWEDLHPGAQADKVNIPVLFEGGWYDIFAQGTIDAFVAVQDHGDTGARGKCRLVMGPWAHGKFNELKYPNANAPQAADAIRWYDHWVRGKKNGVGQEKPVHYYVLGDPEAQDAPGNVWRTADGWPPAATDTPFYLHAEGTLSKTESAKGVPPRTYRYDPKDPVPTVGGANLMMPKGPMDQRSVEGRSDVLLFTSARLEAPVEVTGHITARLWIASTARDTDFAVKLCDVYPDGRSMLVTDGILRARHRRSMRTEDFLSPTKIYKLDIDLWSTSLIFNRGHRIRVAVSSSNSPRFDPNPNTGDPFRANQRTIVAVNTVYMDAAHPSHILLPVPTQSK